MLVFAATVFFLIITPGPGVLSLAGVGSAFGRKQGMHYLTGLFLGHNLVALATVSGLAAIIIADPRIRTVLFIASTAYLLYLAFRIATAGSRIAFIEAREPPGLMGGLALQTINPKAYAVNTAIFSGFNFFPSSLMTEVVLKFIMFNAIWIPIHILWLWLGVTLGQLDLPSRTHRAINIGMSLAMLLVVGLAVYTFTRT
ncbi:MAG: LysE family translocator [Paracoccaceae bacterium]